MSVILEPADGKGLKIPLDKGIVFIGRHPDCDVVITRSRMISRKHCAIVQVNDALVIRDLGSTNGVKVNGERTLRRPLRPGDEISIANHKYTIQYQLPVGSTFEDVFAEEEDVFGQSLMEKAGLEKPKKPGKPGSGRR